MTLIVDREVMIEVIKHALISRKEWDYNRKFRPNIKQVINQIRGHKKIKRSFTSVGALARIQMFSRS